jgi:phosphatidylserine/phosphatidylglycerophosphate/cardiolipin synthase-like enzyme
MIGATPWRYGNQFELLSDSERFFGRMLAAIDAARAYVLLEMYLVQSGRLAERFIAALTAAAGRGVRVSALLDGFGALGLRAQDRRRLIAGGVQLRLYNVLGWRKRFGNFLRNHRKLLLVDGTSAFVGGAGITDDFAEHTSAGGPWRDLMVEIRGPVLHDWERLFGSTWDNSNSNDGMALAATTTPAREDPGAALPLRPCAGRVVASAGWHRSGLASSVVAHVGRARRRVWLVSAYFVPSRRLRRALRRAAHRGVDVRLLLPGSLTDHPVVRHAAHRHFGRLLRHGVHIFEYQPRVLHAKMVICDDWVSIGSSNLDRWSFTWNLEANQEIDDHDFANEAARVFIEDCQQSVQLDRHAWPRRGLGRRLREYLIGFIDRRIAKWPRPRP